MTELWFAFEASAHLNFGDKFKGKVQPKQNIESQSANLHTDWKSAEVSSSVLTFPQAEHQTKSFSMTQSQKLTPDTCHRVTYYKLQLSVPHFFSFFFSSKLQWQGDTTINQTSYVFVFAPSAHVFPKFLFCVNDEKKNTLAFSRFSNNAPKTEFVPEHLKKIISP